MPAERGEAGAAKSKGRSIHVDTRWLRRLMRKASGTDWLVFSVMEGEASFETGRGLKISIAAIAEELGMAKPHVSRAIARLRAFGVIRLDKPATNKACAEYSIVPMRPGVAGGNPSRVDRKRSGSLSRVGGFQSVPPRAKCGTCNDTGETAIAVGPKGPVMGPCSCTKRGRR